MDNGNLAFFTTQELISELVNRKTFLGVVIQSTQELRATRWNGEQVFRIHHSKSLELDEAGRLLGVIADRMEECEEH